MAQTKKAYEEAKIPFVKMTYSPDVPSSALGPNEYNSGLNVETDIRGIRSVAGDEIILQSVPGTPTFVSGGYRKPQAGRSNDFYFVVATTEGDWLASNGDGSWADITPAEGPFATYTQGTNITEAWNGTVPFYNDESNPPMFWPEFTGQSFETLTASSAAGTSTLTFDPQADEVKGLSIIRTDTGGTGTFVYNSGETLKVGQKMTISGTNTNIYSSRANTVSIDDNSGLFSFKNIMLPANFVGSISGTTLTVTSVVSPGVIYNGMLLTGTDSTGADIQEDTYISAYVSGSPTGASVWTVSKSQTIAVGTAITGQRQYPLSVGQSVEISGTFPTATTTLTGVQIQSATGDFSCTSSTIREGQSLTISGTISNSDTTLSSVRILDNTGKFSSAASTYQTGQTVEITGAASTAAVALTSVVSTGIAGQFSCGSTTLLTGQTIRVSGDTTLTPQSLSTVKITGTTGQFSCTAATLAVGQSVVISGSNTSTGSSLAGVAVTGTAGQFSCTATTLAVGQSIAVSGDDTGFTLSGVAITGAAGQFSCTASSSTLKVGQTITISGARTGTGTITDYVNPTEYSISATNGSTTFTLTDTSGDPIVTSAGTTAGLTFNVNEKSIFGYSNPTVYTISATNGTTTFTLTTGSGTALVTNIGTPTDLGFAITPPGIVSYTNPTTYLISATNGSTTFTLTDTDGAAIATVPGTPTGLSYNVSAPAIQGYSNPTDYLIKTTNGTTTFTLTNMDNSAIVTTGGTLAGLTFTLQAPNIQGYTSPTNYLISATNGSTEFTLVNKTTGEPIVTTGGLGTGATVKVLKPAIAGYTNPTTYQIYRTNGLTSFTLVDSTGNAIDTTGGTPTGLTYTLAAPSISGYTDPKTYYIDETNGASYFVLSETFTVSGVAIAGTGGQFTCSAASSVLKLGQRMVISGTFGGTGSITGYTNPTIYKISATNGSTTFTLTNLDDTAIVTTAGTPTGLTYSITSRLTTTGGLVTTAVSVFVRPPSITGYSDPTTYFITSTNANNQFTLSSTLGGSPITTAAGTLDGLTFVYSPFAIGQTILVENIVPTGFRGTHTVTGVTQSSVSYAGSTAGPQTTPGSVSDPHPVMIMYSNIVPGDIAATPTGIQFVNATTQKITLATPYAVAPYVAGDKIVISGVSNYYNGTYTVVSSTTDTITYTSVPGAAFPGDGGTVAPLYSWNYNPNWQGYHAQFMRLYNTPNVGSILIAGGLTVTTLDGSIEEYPVSVQWSQAFGLNEAPETWEPTVLNVANQLEVPLRGTVIDGFPCNGQFFLCSYWDTVVFSPLNYSTTSAPILGVRLHSQGRGMLTSNCWANTDKMVYGLDARDIWVFDGQDFKGLGNQRVKNWFYDQLDPNYTERVFMQTNTQKNQIEIYYPTKVPVISNINIVDTSGTFSCELEYGYDTGPMRNGLSVVLSGTESGSGSISGYAGGPTTYYVVDNYELDGLTYFQLSTTPTGNGVTTTAGTVIGVDFNFESDGVPNMMLAYRHDLDCFNAPREVQAATFACESPVWGSQQWYFNVPGTTLTGTGTGARFNILRYADSYEGGITPNVRGSGYAVGDTILILGTALGGNTPANDAVVTVTETNLNGRILDLTVAGTAANEWTYNDGRRTVVYARGLLNRNLVTKDEGYNFLGPQLREYPVASNFRRDNIKILDNYSGKLLVHRVLPEVNNLAYSGLPVNPVQEDYLVGSVSIKVEGANSVGQAPLETTAITLATNTDYPWVQITQNAHRVNSLEISNSSTENIWICNSTTWQYTQTEDDR